MSLRLEKINQEIRKQIVAVIQSEVDDPALDFVSITKVDTSPDLRECKVYFSLLNDAQIQHAQDTLNKMSKFIRVNLGKKITMKFLPNLRFLPDESIKYSVDIFNKIEEVRKHDTDFGSEEENFDE